MNRRSATVKNTTRVGLAAALAIGLAGASATAAQACPTHSTTPVFVQTDGAAGNAIVAFDRSSTGALTKAGTYPTGGLGGALDGSVADHTASENALVRDGQNLFAVNAGSNTLTSFAVSGDHLIRRQTISSGGTFPVSIASHGDLLYILNARGGGSIQGYLNVDGYLAKLPQLSRKLGFNPNPTPEFTSTPAEVAFTPDGSQVVVSTKGDGSSFDVFASHGLLGLASKPVITTVAGAVPFGFTFDRGGHLVATEAGTNSVASFTVQRNGTVTPISTQATGQMATCWIDATPTHEYASNAGSGTESIYGDNGSGQLHAQGAATSGNGTVDATVTPDNRFLYAQNGADGTISEFAIQPNGALASIGTVTVPGGMGGEGIVAF
jgi:6-phosphogluconolactonase (cycloisomerase 2 family)